MINYYRFCCRIRIADEYADEVPGGEFLAVEEGSARERRAQFAASRVSEFSDWFTESPALLAHIRGVQIGRPDLRSRWVDTEAALIYTKRSKQDLYALAARGRLSRYREPKGSHYRAMWDVLELDSVKRDTL